MIFTDAQARTVDSARATIDVAPGATKTWTAKRRFDAPKDVQCVVRAVTHAP